MNDEKTRAGADPLAGVHSASQINDGPFTGRAGRDLGRPNVPRFESLSDRFQFDKWAGTVQSRQEFLNLS